jgi:hypothetical protein
MGVGRQYGCILRQVRQQEGILFPNANAISRRTNVNLLSVRSMRSPMEGELGWSAVFLFSLFLVLSVNIAVCTEVADNAGTRDILENPPSSKFHMVLFTCIYGRPKLTTFILDYYASIRESLAHDENIKLDIFIAGSDPHTTAPLAARVGAGHADHPNSPLGAKHNSGLKSLRDWYLTGTYNSSASVSARPDVVVVIGSDDLLNRNFFLMARNRMAAPMTEKSSAVLDVLGLRDLHIYELSSRRLMYSKGYRKFNDPLDATIGCGRVFRWTMLERMNWTLWDGSRERSLDQSTVRLVANALGEELLDKAEAVLGFAEGVAAVDIKTGDLAGGRNIWSFDDLVAAVGRNGRLHRFRMEDDVDMFERFYWPGFATTKLAALRKEMKPDECQSPVQSISLHNRCLANQQDTCDI